MADVLPEDQASWAEVASTMFFTSATTVFFLTVFEIARRNPLVSSIFDNRRKANPGKTPPPLIRSRIFEWLFLSTDPSYTENAELAHKKEVIKERRRQRKAYSYKAKQGSLPTIPEPTTLGVATILEEEEEGKKSETEQDLSADEINGDTSKRSFVSSDNSELGSQKFLDDDVESLSVVENISVSSRKKFAGTLFSKIKEKKSEHSDSDSETPTKRKREIRRTHSILTPDVVTISGRRLPASVAEYAIAGDLTDDELDRYESKLLAQEKEEERLFKERQRELLNKRGMKTNKSSDDNKNDEENNMVDLNIPLPPRYFGNFGIENSEGTLPGKNALNRFIKKSGHKNDDDVAYKDGSNEEPTSPSHTRSKINRQLNTTTQRNKRKLSVADRELLRFIGLDTFVMIRFLRFGFHTSFYPFIVACIVLIPTYYTHDYVPPIELKEGFKDPTGYFRFTISRLGENNQKHWVSWIFAILFHLYVLRRLWVEWETFLPLRFDFLANGHVAKAKQGRIFQNEKDDKRLHLQQFQNSCLVQYVPESHRRDQELFHFFDALFPNGVKRAEILLNASRLTELISQREKLLAQYESIYAKQYHDRQVFRRKLENHQNNDNGLSRCFCWLCNRKGPKKPDDRHIKIDGKKNCFCRKQKKIKALPYLLGEIKNINIDIEKEHRKIIKERNLIEDKHQAQELLTTGFSNAKKFVTGVGGGLNCDTGFVEFKNLTMKQTALQCNITGTANCMVISAAPDPRDVIWPNMTVKLKYIKIKKMQIKLLLMTGMLFWSVVVTGITSISNLDRLKHILPSWLIPTPGTILDGAIQGYLPVIFLELLMLIIPFILSIIARSFIGLKTNSEVDRFVFIWHFGFRIANLVIIIFKNQFYETLVALRNSPDLALGALARGVSVSSQFFLNNIIFAAGTENMIELCQVIHMLEHVVLHIFTTLEAKSQREIEKLYRTKKINWGETVPPFIFAFLVAVVYSTIVPLILGMCAIFFFIATKVYIHQALFVYSQPYEGGGTLMYKLNRSIFVILYISVGFFTMLLSLKKHPGMASSFLVIMILIIILVDRKIAKTFVIPSRTLALASARMYDEVISRANQHKQTKTEKAEKIKKRRKEFPNLNDSYGKTSTGNNEKDEESFFKQQEKDLKKKARRNSRKYRDDSDEDSDESSPTEDTDFYLYRQPQLNKSTWETKPRPYR